MGEVSEISWTHSTFNPWIGCERVSPACDFCYADRGSARLGAQHGLKLWDGDRYFTSEKYWAEPHKWNKKAALSGEPHRVFCASYSDVFEDRRDLDERRGRLFELIEDTLYLDWLLLTKRPEKMVELAPNRWRGAWPDNVWAGTTAENDAYALERSRHLWHVPAAIKFLSLEPMLGPVSRQALATGGVDWCITGAESGPKARPMHPKWARDVRDWCLEHGVSYHHKQWGEWGPKRQISMVLTCPERWGTIEECGSFFEGFTPWNGHDDDGPGAGAVMYRVGKVTSGRALDGRIWNEFPR